MSKDKKTQDNPEEPEVLKKAPQAAEEGTAAEEKTEEGAGESSQPESGELDLLRVQLDDKSKQCEEYLTALQRTAAEFDNFRKRTAREKEALYSEAVSDVVTAFLPVVDNLERAIQACSGENDNKTLKEGVDLVARQVRDVLKKLGIEEIKSVGEAFDPLLHNAVMHMEDDSLGHNVVVEEFQKGYRFKEKVIRHSMVKVAN